MADVLESRRTVQDLRMPWHKSIMILLRALGAGSFVLFIAWQLLPSPTDFLYSLFSASPEGLRDPVFTYYLARLAWPTLIVGICASILAYILKTSPALWTESEKATPSLNPGWGVFLASWLALFFEILCIRWLGSEIRMLAYFKNLTLMCAFLGLGGGMLLRDKKLNLLPYFPIIFGLLTVLAISPGGKVLGRLNLPGEGILFWFEYWPENVGVLATAALSFITLLIVLQTILFLPLGQAIARWMQLLPPIQGYSINIGGSLTGLWTFSALSFFSSPSWIWFAVGLGLFLALVSFYYQPRPVFIQAGICVLLVVGVALANRGSVWSPYYKIEAVPQFLDIACEDAYLGQYYKARGTGKIPWGHTLSYNGLQFVAALDTSEEFIAKHPAYRACRDIQVQHNEIAFKLFPPQDKEVLILASGPGNDVASALRFGAAHIDAVDIDPMPIVLGKQLHPEKPYAHPNVTTYVDDARAFLQRSTTKYDYVFFASLDSQVLLSGMSSIRLDNFIYTKEAIHAAKQRLSPDGILAIYYWGGGVKEWVPKRFERMLLDNFPEEQVFSDGGLYVAGTPVRAWKHSRLEEGLSSDVAVDPRTVPTDDWPFLYLRSRHIPFVFVYMAIVLIGLSALMAYGAQQRLREVHVGFLFLGAGFLLLETKAVTQMALLYGSTWFVNTVVFSVILSVVLLGNYFITRFPDIKTEHLYLGLGVALLANYFFNVGDLLKYPLIYRGPLSSLVLGAPFFFAASIFAQKFKNTPQDVLGAALGSNLIGTTMGGIVEYASLVTGIQFLVLLALTFYSLALFAERSGKRRRIPA